MVSDYPEYADEFRRIDPGVSEEELAAELEGLEEEEEDKE